MQAGAYAAIATLATGSHKIATQAGAYVAIATLATAPIHVYKEPQLPFISLLSLSLTYIGNRLVHRSHPFTLG